MQEGTRLEPGEDVAVTSISRPSVAAEKARRLRLAAPGPRLWWLVLPMLILFVAFFLIPVASLFAISLDHPTAGAVRLRGDLDTANFVRIFTREIYTSSILSSLAIAAAMAQYPGVEATDIHIKEKFGGIRVHFRLSGAPPELRDMMRPIIEEAETLSLPTCEVCGRADTLRDEAGWFVVRCDTHAGGPA